MTRGPLQLRGEGDEIVVDMPLRATIAARDVGGVLKGETATGAAMAHARVRIELTPDWRTQGKARITYGWTKEPGIDFLGKRITFTDEADAKLKPVVRDVEREVNREIAKIDIRGQAADIWRQSFTALELNHENPPVWMRVTPQRILYGGYRIDGQRMNLNLGLEAITETFVSGTPRRSGTDAIAASRPRSAQAPSRCARSGDRRLCAVAAGRRPRACQAIGATVCAAEGRPDDGEIRQVDHLWRRRRPDRGRGRRRCRSSRFDRARRRAAASG